MHGGSCLKLQDSSQQLVLSSHQKAMKLYVEFRYVIATISITLTECEYHVGLRFHSVSPTT
jgi:hypothetical protein